MASHQLRFQSDTQQTQQRERQKSVARGSKCVRESEGTHSGDIERFVYTRALVVLFHNMYYVCV